MIFRFFTIHGTMNHSFHQFFYVVMVPGVRKNLILIFAFRKVSAKKPHSHEIVILVKIRVVP